jgi:hypothetical protein
MVQVSFSWFLQIYFGRLKFAHYSLFAHRPVVTNVAFRPLPFLTFFAKIIQLPKSVLCSDGEHQQRLL